MSICHHNQPESSCYICSQTNKTVKKTATFTAVNTESKQDTTSNENGFFAWISTIFNRKTIEKVPAVAEKVKYQKSIYDLALHEFTDLENLRIRILRVHNGWTYTQHTYRCGDDSAVTACFVPHEGDKHGDIPCE
jgi:hypothetical protein